MELTAAAPAVRLRPAAASLRAELPRPAPARPVPRGPLGGRRVTPGADFAGQAVIPEEVSRPVSYRPVETGGGAAGRCLPGRGHLTPGWPRRALRSQNVSQAVVLGLGRCPGSAPPGAPAGSPRRASASPSTTRAAASAATHGIRSTAPSSGASTARARSGWPAVKPGARDRDVYLIPQHPRFPGRQPGAGQQPVWPRPGRRVTRAASASGPRQRSTVGLGAGPLRGRLTALEQLNGLAAPGRQQGGAEHAASESNTPRMVVRLTELQSPAPERNCLPHHGRGAWRASPGD